MVERITKHKAVQVKELGHRDKEWFGSIFRGHRLETMWYEFLVTSTVAESRNRTDISLLDMEPNQR